MLNWVKCLFKPHVFEEVHRCRLDNSAMIFMAEMEATRGSLVVREVPGNKCARDVYDHVCSRCGRIKGFRYGGVSKEHVAVALLIILFFALQIAVHLILQSKGM